MSDHHQYDQCSCGHDHDDHDSCGHKYNREPGRQKLFGQVDEAPAIFSDTFEMDLEKEVKCDNLKALLTEWIEGLKEWAKKRKYYIGHIKAFIDSKDGYSLWLSTTGSGINVNDKHTNQSGAVSRCSISLTMIVFGTDKKTMQKAAVEQLTHVMERA